jgi:hypothetical protein
MKVIDLQRIRETLPKNGIVELKSKETPKGRVLYLSIVVQWPSLSELNPLTFEKDFEMILDWQEEIIGKENIMEFYTITTGQRWEIYLRRVPMEFINVSNKDIEVYISDRINSNQ